MRRLEAHAQEVAAPVPYIQTTARAVAQRAVGPCNGVSAAWIANSARQHRIMLLAQSLLGMHDYRALRPNVPGAKVRCPRTVFSHEALSLRLRLHQAPGSHIHRGHSSHCSPSCCGVNARCSCTSPKRARSECGTSWRRHLWLLLLLLSLRLVLALLCACRVARGCLTLSRRTQFASLDVPDRR